MPYKTLNGYSVHECLFDVKKDPCEMRNIIEQKPAIAKKLKSALNNYKVVKPVNFLSLSMDVFANPSLYNNIWIPWQDSGYSIL